MTSWKWLLPLVSGLYGAHASAAWIDEVGIELRYDDNITRAQLDWDIKRDTALVISAAKGTRYQLTDNSKVSLTATLSGAAYRRYDGLDNLNAGLALAYRWKPGLGPYVPEVHVLATAARLEFRDAARDGWLYGGEFGITKRLSDRAGLQMVYQVEQRRSDNVAQRLVPTIAANVFDLNSRSLRLGADYALSADYVLAGAYTIRDGDIVSTTLRNMPIFLASSAIAMDPVFGPDRVAYTMKALTRGLSLGVSRLIGGQTSLTLGYEHLNSRADGGISYRANQVRAVYLHQY
jgi:hypothetical protein